jgi:hypothetical protein
MRLRLLAAVFVVLALTAIPAQAGQDIEASTFSGPPGTVVTITEANDACSTQSRILLMTFGLESEVGASEPFDPPNGTFTIPQVAPGEYQVAIKCGDTTMNSFVFRVAPTAVLANPTFAG